MNTEWIVSDSELVEVRSLTGVTINNAKFPYQLHFHSITFTLHGLISFNHCSFTGDVTINIRGSQYEPQSPQIKTLSSFLSFYVVHQPIKIYKSQLRLYGTLWIDVTHTGRELQISHCDIDFEIEIKSELVKKDTKILFSLQIAHGKMSDSVVSIKSVPMSFIYIKMNNMNMFNVKFTNSDQDKLSLLVENCTWVNNKSFMDVSQVISVNLSSSQLTTNCHACSLMSVHGLMYEDYRDWLDYYSIKYVLIDIMSCSSTLSMVSTTLKSETSFNQIDTESVCINLVNSTFIITESISFYIKTDFKAENVLIHCSTSQMVQRTIGESSIIYACKPKCEGKSEYSLQSGRLKLSEELDYYNALKVSYFSEPLLIPNNPSCLPCPLGVNCEGVIQSLPNYWGYVTPELSISMVRCPDGYCCQGNETCKGINSCNLGRIGTLCGNCEQNLTEALFTPKCVLAESCRSTLIVVLFISAALIYAAALLSFGTIKHKITYLLKNGYKLCKGRFQKDKRRDKCRHEQKSVENVEADSGIKYMQILLYYVQDSKLFTVHLPQMNTKAENVFVKFLEFSPDILAAYIKATEFCFAFSSAISNIVLKLSFGFVVMFFLFFVYAIQSLVSFTMQRKFGWTEVNVKLVQAFLLTVLFSYQKLVMGTFSLVQCIAIGEHNILFIQPDIHCYTWWQIGILVYICISVVPIFFVLAHAPFYVKDKKMSVRTFIMACLLPLPVLVLYHVFLLMKMKSVHKKLQGKCEIETYEMAEVSCKEKFTDCEGKNSEKINRKLERSESKLAVTKASAETCEEIVVESLLKHYKCLSVFGIRFTWLGVHKIYRVILVACRTFITDQVIRLYVMTAMLMVMTFFNATIKPYKEQRANTTATLSYIANLCIAILNLMKANYVAFGCDNSCHYRDTVVGYMDKFEEALLLYVPLVAVVLWFIHRGVQKCLGKCRKTRV